MHLRNRAVRLQGFRCKSKWKWSARYRWWCHCCIGLFDQFRFSIVCNALTFKCHDFTAIHAVLGHNRRRIITIRLQFITESVEQNSNVASKYLPWADHIGTRRNDWSQLHWQNHSDRCYNWHNPLYSSEDNDRLPMHHRVQCIAKCHAPSPSVTNIQICGN